MNPDSTTSQEFDEVALEKLRRVLGQEPASRLFSEVLREMKLDTLQTAEQLYAFGEAIAQRPGFEAAVGRLITIAAVVRGARGGG